MIILDKLYFSQIHLQQTSNTHINIKWKLLKKISHKIIIIIYHSYKCLFIFAFDEIHIYINWTGMILHIVFYRFVLYKKEITEFAFYTKILGRIPFKLSLLNNTIFTSVNWHLLKDFNICLFCL